VEEKRERDMGKEKERKNRVRERKEGRKIGTFSVMPFNECEVEIRCQFRQRYFLYKSFLGQIFLVTFWLWQKIHTKNLRVKH
jgi:hypothetical protein